MPKPQLFKSDGFQSPNIEAYRAWSAQSKLFVSNTSSEVATTHRFSFLCQRLNTRLKKVPGNLQFHFVPFSMECPISAEKGLAVEAKAPALLLTDIGTKKPICKVTDLKKILATVQRFAEPLNLQVVQGTRLLRSKTENGSELSSIRSGQFDQFEVAGQDFTPIAIAVTTKRTALRSSSGAAELCQQLKTATLDNPAALRSLSRELSRYFILAKRALRNARLKDQLEFEKAA
jgi:hypothetical protein